MTGIGGANLGLRFLLELGGIAALAYAGWQGATALPMRLLLAIGGAGVLVVAWALVVAPNADNPIAPTVRELIGTGLLLGAAGALFWAGQRTPALVFGALVLVNQVLLVVFAERG